MEASIFPGQPTPLSPAHSSNLPTTTTASSSASSTPHHDVTMTSLSLPDLGGIPSQTSSLLSLHGSGVAGGPPGQLTAGAHAAVGPLIVEEVQSLHALCEGEGGGEGEGGRLREGERKEERGRKREGEGSKRGRKERGVDEGYKRGRRGKRLM